MNAPTQRTKPTQSNISPVASGPLDSEGRRLWQAAAIWAGVVGLLTVACWTFPAWWYSEREPGNSGFWLDPVTNAPPWQFTSLPIAKAAESQLAADYLFSGAYRDREGGVVTVFTAKRLDENPNVLGLFVHTPDFCWAQGGWRLDANSVGTREVLVHGIRVLAERRVFETRSGHRELVLFFGLVHGQPLPYRLDQNLAISLRSASQQSPVKGGSFVAGGQLLFWERVWDAFKSRRPLLGPKQFIRVSTPLISGREVEAEALLTRAFNELFTPEPFSD